MAAAGLATLRDAQMFSSPTYGWAEKSTGGELFLPRLGSRQRGHDLLSVGARWYGGTYTRPGAGAGAGAGGGTFVGTLVMEDGTFMGRVRGEMHAVVDGAFTQLADAQTYATA